MTLTDTLTDTVLVAIQQIITSETEIIRGKGRRSKNVSFSKQIENIRYFRKSDPVIKIKYANGSPSTGFVSSMNGNNGGSNTSPNNSDNESGSDKESDPLEMSSPLPEAISGLTTKQLLSRGSSYFEQFVKEKPHYSLRSQACNILPFDSLIQKIEQFKVSIDGLSLSHSGESLEGSIVVKNLTFNKKVVFRYSTDEWSTFHDVEAKYHSSDSVYGIDRFSFSIDLRKYLCSHESSTVPPVLYFAVQYISEAGEFWDNNNNSNYRVDFVTQKHIHSSTTPSPCSTPALNFSATSTTSSTTYSAFGLDF